MTIKQFIVGHKYIYLGVSRANEIFWSKEIDFIFLPQVLTCINAGDDDIPSAMFKEQGITGDYLWDWTFGIENWVDITNMPDEEIQKILADKRKRLVAERI